MKGRSTIPFCQPASPCSQPASVYMSFIHLHASNCGLIALSKLEMEIVKLLLLTLSVFKILA